MPPAKPKWAIHPSLAGPLQERMAASSKITVHPKQRHPVIVCKQWKVETPIEINSDNNTDATIDHTKDDSRKDLDGNTNQGENTNNNVTASTSAKPSPSNKWHVFVSRTVGFVKHKRKRIFKCSKCETRKATQGEINKHYWENHTQVKCYVCQQLFKTPATLARHLYSHEITTKQCRCGKTFHFASELKTHKLTHQQIKTEHCQFPKCGKSYFSANDLAKQVKQHSYKEWKCDVCTYTTKDERLLKSHYRKHSQAIKYTCATCEKGFV